MMVNLSNRTALSRRFPFACPDFFCLSWAPSDLMAGRVAVDQQDFLSEELAAIER
jgi:hypothetical protein